MRYFILGAAVFALAAASLAVAQPGSSSPAIHPPPIPPRVAAEWEPVVGVIIGWPLKLPQALVKELAREVDLYLSVESEADSRQATRTLTGWGIDARRLRFIVTEHGTGYYLPRDWGPNAVYRGPGSYHLIDGRLRDYPLSSVGSEILGSFTPFLRRGYRADDAAPGAVARLLNAPRVELPISLTGGNLLFDGHGSAFATQVLIDENKHLGYTQEQFLAMMREHLGVQRFHVIPNFERIGIQHIDCVMKVLDEERILVKRVPVDHGSYPHVENVVRHLETLTNPRGRPYQIHRIDTQRYLMFKLAGYTNSLIVNRKIYVPLFGVPTDQTALETWRQMMPGYEVMGFHHNRWSFTDALHCRVRGVWDPAMLYLSHHRPPCQIPWAPAITLSVQIRDYSGAGLLGDRLALHWRPRGQRHWQSSPLRFVGDDTFAGQLRDLAPGQSVEYFFAAASASGRQETMPRTAPQAAYLVTIGPPG